jgi:hypothetical protein
MIERTAPATTGVAKLGVLQVASGENHIEAISNCLQFPSSFQLRPSLGKVTAFVKAMPFGEERYTLTQGADANAR